MSDLTIAGTGKPLICARCCREITLPGQYIIHEWGAYHYGCAPVPSWPAPAAVEVEITRLRAENERRARALSDLRAAAGRAISGLREWYGQDVFRNRVVDVPEIAALISALSKDLTADKVDT